MYVYLIYLKDISKYNLKCKINLDESFTMISTQKQEDLTSIVFIYLCMYIYEIKPGVSFYNM